MGTVDGKPLSRFRPTWRNTMAQATVVFNKLQQAVVDAVDAQGSAEDFTRGKIMALLEGDEVISDEASATIKTLNELVRTFNGEVVAVDALRKSKEPARKKAVRRYDTISKAFLLLKNDAKGLVTTNRTKKLQPITVLVTAKQHSGFAKAQQAALRKREKADFPIVEMIAAYAAIEKIIADFLDKK